MSSEIEQVDAFILASLPNTYGRLVARATAQGRPEWERPIDRRLQALRKKGVISFARVGRQSIWNTTAGATA